MSVPDAKRVVLFSASLPGWDARRVIEAAVALGLPAVEWGVGPGHAIEDVRSGAEIRHRCDDGGLTVSGLSIQDPAITLATPRRVGAYVRLAAALGAPRMRLFAPPYQGGSVTRLQARLRSGLDAIVELAAAAQIGVLVETSPDTLAPTPELAMALVEHHRPERAGVLYDPGNMVIEGHVLPPLAVARLGRHLRHVHVKNIVWYRRARAWRWRYATLAGGLLDWPEILGVLAAARYQGLFSIDHLPGRASSARLAAESNHLRALVARAYAR
jgi:sugar phosphate isomerase/epimerase